MTFKVPPEWATRPISIDLLGAGGTGYYVATALFQLERVLRGTTNGDVGFDRIRVYDPKEIREPNLARTGYLPWEIGFKKAEVICNKLNSALGYDLFESHADYWERANWRTDLIITATDSLASRLCVAEKYRRLWLDLGVSEQTATAVLGDLSLEKQLPASLDLFPTDPETNTQDHQSCDMRQSLAAQAFGVNQTIATAGVNLIAQLLLDGEIHHHGMMIDLKTGYHNPLRICESVWASFGWDRAA